MAVLTIAAWQSGNPAHRTRAAPLTISQPHARMFESAR
jgi:hypothetical protein